MATHHVHRLSLIVPVAKVPVVAAWLNGNISPDAVPSNLGPPLNATGLATDPVTHRWLSAAFTDPECKAIIAKLCQLAAVTPPTGIQWAGWSGQQKRAWLLTVQTAMRTNYGIWVSLSDNVGRWDSADDVLQTMNLKRVAITP